MKKLRIGIWGRSGKMASEIRTIIQSSADFELADEAGRQGPQNGHPVDVWIDFSLPEGTLLCLEHCLKNKTPMVCGVTGLGPDVQKCMSETSQAIPIFYSRNMSLGIAKLSAALKVFSESDPFDFQIEEVHHTMKKDSPSGTSLILQESLQQAVNKDLPQPLAIRGGGVFGIHRVWAMSSGEYLTFEHVALSRKVFAEGSLAAAKFISRKTHGFFGMSDLVQNKE